MFFFGNFLGAIAKILNITLTLYMWIIIIRALLSWVRPDPHNPIVQLLYRITEPVLNPIRKKMPYLGGIDFSPLVVILIIIFLQSFVVDSLTIMAARLR